MTRLRSRLWLAGAAFAVLVSSARPAHAIDEFRHPRLHRAAQQLDDANDTLQGEQRSESEFGGHRARAIELLRQAKGELEQAAQYADSRADATPPPDNTAYPADTSADTSYGSEPTYDDPPADWVPPPEPVVYYNAPPPPSPVGFWGHHPIPGGGWCLAEGPHLHEYEPEFFDQFRLVDGYFKFGEGFHEWAFAGPHPIPGGGWCNIYAPHRHDYRPEVGFIYDPVRRGYYYDRERAVAIRTVVVHPPPSYHPPMEVVAHYNHPAPVHAMPVGTPRPQPWQHEHVIAQPHPVGHYEAHPTGRPMEQHPQGHPMEQHPVEQHPMQAHPVEQHPQGHPMEQHPMEAHPMQQAHPEPQHEMAHPAPAAHEAPHAAPPPLHAMPAKAPPAKAAPKPDDKKKDDKKK